MNAVASALPHDSARAHVTGTATYIDDIPEIRGTLHGAPVMATVAHGRLNGIVASEALASPGVRGVVLARDIPGDPKPATFVHDEAIYATDEVHHIGQVVGIVVADTVMNARRAARKVKLDIDPLPAILSPRDAHAQLSYVLLFVLVWCGVVVVVFLFLLFWLFGVFEVGGQEHFYLEGQVAYVFLLCLSTVTSLFSM